MKAIISDHDARALLNKLELVSLRAHNHVCKDSEDPVTFAEVHRAFHYVVVQWLQEQGADCVGS